jgi:hypothetical protein
LIALDFVVKLLGLVESLTGVIYDNILVIMERLIKYRYFILYKEESIAKELAYIFEQVIVINYGMLKEIISDRGTLFTSKFWQALIGQLRVKHKLSTAYYL